MWPLHACAVLFWIFLRFCLHGENRCGSLAWTAASWVITSSMKSAPRIRRVPQWIEMDWSHSKGFTWLHMASPDRRLTARSKRSLLQVVCDRYSYNPRWCRETSDAVEKSRMDSKIQQDTARFARTGPTVNARQDSLWQTWYRFRAEPRCISA